MRPISLDLVIRKSVPYTKIFYLVGLNTLSKEIMGIVTKSPAVIVVPAHGLTHEWPVWFTNAQESMGIDQEFLRLKKYTVEPVDENTLSIKDFSIPSGKLGNDILKFASMGQINSLDKASLEGFDYQMTIRQSRNLESQTLHTYSMDKMSIDSLGQLVLSLSLDDLKLVQFQRARYEIRRIENSVPSTIMFEGFVSVLNT